MTGLVSRVPVPQTLPGKADSIEAALVLHSDEILGMRTKTGVA